MVPALLSSLHFPSIAHVIEAALKTFYNASQTHLLNHYFLCQPTRLRMVATTWTWTSLFLPLCLPLGILLSSFLPVQKASSSEAPLKCPHSLSNSILNHFQTRKTSSSSAYVISMSSPHTPRTVHTGPNAIRALESHGGKHSISPNTLTLKAASTRYETS